jgi:hypothetical protein
MAQVREKIFYQYVFYYFFFVLLCVPLWLKLGGGIRSSLKLEISYVILLILNLK